MWPLSCERHELSTNKYSLSTKQWRLAQTTLFGICWLVVTSRIPFAVPRGLWIAVVEGIERSQIACNILQYRRSRVPRTHQVHSAVGNKRRVSKKSRFAFL